MGKKMSLLLCNGGQKLIFQFFLLAGKLKVNFFLFPPEKFYEFDHIENCIRNGKFLLHKILSTLSSNWKMKICTTLLIKSW